MLFSVRLAILTAAQRRSLEVKHVEHVKATVWNGVMHRACTARKCEARSSHPSAVTIRRVVHKLYRGWVEREEIKPFRGLAWLSTSRGNFEWHTYMARPGRLCHDLSIASLLFWEISSTSVIYPACSQRSWNYFTLVYETLLKTNDACESCESQTHPSSCAYFVEFIDSSKHLSLLSISINMFCGHIESLSGN